MNLNKVILIGRVVENPETRTTPTGQKVATLRMATNRMWTDKQGQRQEKSEFHSVVLWQRLADIAAQYLQKGGLVMIEGHLETRSWQDTTGAKRYRTEIIAEAMQLGPRSSGQGAPPPRKEGAAPLAADKDQKQEEPNEEIPIIDEDEDIDVKDIPF
ncbi:MAG: single-stranded DNA-binding protein [Candidatus Wildermuthbacteria bacterium]|nr:single-stranded DNA-binding protein [Candidatus Wildermuthbacteria bacterium]